MDSAIPSTKPTDAIEAPRTVVKNIGVTGYSISLATSAKNETKLSFTTVGLWAMVFWLFPCNSILYFLTIRPLNNKSVDGIEDFCINSLCAVDSLGKGALKK